MQMVAIIDIILTQSPPAAQREISFIIGVISLLAYSVDGS